MTELSRLEQNVAALAAVRCRRIAKEREIVRKLSDSLLRRR